MSQIAKLVLLVCLSLLVQIPVCFAQERSNYSLIESFATDLISKPSPEQRDALLDAKKDLVTSALRKSIIRQGNAQMMSGQYARAFDIYNIARTVSTRINDKEGLAAAALNIGTVHYFQGDLTRALENYQTARRYNVEINNNYEAAKALSGVALIQKEMKNDAAALHSFEQVLTEFTTLNDREEMASTLNSIAAIYYSRGEYAAASRTLLRSAELNPDSENKLRTADAFYMQGDFEKASDFYNQALKEFTDRRSGAGLTSAITGAANSAYYLGNYDEALELFRRNIIIQNRINDESGVASSYQGLGNVFRSLGDLSSALDAYLKSLDHAARSPVAINSATTFGSIGLVRALQGDNQDAVAYYAKSLLQFEASGDKVGQARMLSYIGNSQYAEGDYKEALSSYQKSLELRESMNDQPNRANLMVGIGIVHMTTEQFQPALDSFSSALKIYESLGNRDSIADTQLRIAETYLRKKEPQQTLSFTERALSLARQIDNADLQWYAKLVEGKAHYALGHKQQALESFIASASIVETLRARPFAGEAGPARSTTMPYLALVDLLIEQNKAADAFTYAEDARIESLSSMLKRGHALSTRGLSVAQRDQERKLAAQIASAELQLSRESESRNATESRRAELMNRRRVALNNYAQLQKNVYATFPDLKIARGELPQAKSSELHAIITDRETAYLQFVVTENNIYLFVATADEELPSPKRQATRLGITIKAYPLASRPTELVIAVLRFNELLASRDPSFAESAEDLFNHLLRPSSQQLAGKKNLIISPDGFLWRVPFESLMSSKDNYLIDQAAVTYAHSLSGLRQVMKPSIRSTGRDIDLVVFADPKLSDDQRRRVEQSYKVEPRSLPATQQEIQSVQRLFGNSQTKSFFGADANEEKARTEIGSAGVINFAGPALLDDTSPMFSSVVLTPIMNSKFDGNLQVKEIVNLQTRANLVLMPFASFANSRIANGDSINGLAWSWFVAGARSTMLSRWNIQTTSSLQPNLELHTLLKSSSQKRRNNPESLRQLMLSIRNSSEHQHPYFWAGYMLVGDPR